MEKYQIIILVGSQKIPIFTKIWYNSYTVFVDHSFHEQFMEAPVF